MQLRHYILKCIHLEWRWLFGPFRYMLIQTVWLIVQIISIPDEDLFSETAVGCTASYVVKIIWCSCWFCTPPPYLEAEYCLFCGRRRVAVARYRMICLVSVLNYTLSKERCEGHRLWCEEKEKYRGVYEIQKSGDKTSSGEIGPKYIQVFVRIR